MQIVRPWVKKSPQFTFQWVWPGQFCQCHWPWGVKACWVLAGSGLTAAIGWMDSLINVMCTNSGSLNCICVKARPLRNGEWICERKGAGFNADGDNLQYSEFPNFGWVQTTDLVLGLLSWLDHVGEVEDDQALHLFIYFLYLLVLRGILFSVEIYKYNL